MLTRTTGAPAREEADAATARVAVVITTYNHAHFLDSALASIAAQSVPAAEVVVVDDGSTDDPAPVVARFPQARLIRQPNRGLAAARNAGLKVVEADFVLFLDADDVLFPTAIESGLRAMAANPGAAFVYGAYQFADAELTPTSGPQFRPFAQPAFHALLRDNLIGMHGAVLYDRAKLARSGGFDESLGLCEDYDVYLRLARSYRVGCHPEVVALYRIHTDNLSSNVLEMLYWHRRVRESNPPRPTDRAGMRAFRRGYLWETFAYALSAWRARSDVSAANRYRQRWSILRRHPGAALTAGAWEIAKRTLPAAAIQHIKRAARREAPGTIDMGTLARPDPISRLYGQDRGTPIDRRYIEAFLEREAEAIRGRVLEVGEWTYSRRFGQGIVRQDVLHVHPGNPEATIVGDLTHAGVLPEASFDCAIVTQALQLIYDVPAALRHLHRALRPGGVLLATVPGITASHSEWGSTWYWSFTRLSCERLLGEVFGPGNVEVGVHGNVYAAAAFLHGLAVEDVERDWLDRLDPAYPVTITIRATRAG